MNDIRNLKKTIQHLILHSPFLEDIGLFHGKLGISIVLYHYARYTNDSLYQNIADNLLEQVITAIPPSIPIGISNGTCGIGWGICHLLENGFIDGDADEILQIIDGRVLEYNPLNYIDLSFENGLQGIYTYVMKRNKSNNGSNYIYPIKFLQDLEKRMSSDNSLSDILITDFVNRKAIAHSRFNENWFNLGLHEGYAGKALLIMNV